MNRIIDLTLENKFHSVGCSSANYSTFIATVSCQITFAKFIKPLNRQYM